MATLTLAYKSLKNDNPPALFTEFAHSEFYKPDHRFGPPDLAIQRERDLKDDQSQPEPIFDVMTGSIAGYSGISQYIQKELENLWLTNITDVSESYLCAQKRSESVKIIMEIITERDSNEIERLEKKLSHVTSGREIILADIAMEQKELINIRALSARLLFAKNIYDTVHHEFREKMNLLKKHKSPLIRLGVLLGLADCRNLEEVRSFLQDSHAVVRNEAAEILDDLEDEE